MQILLHLIGPHAKTVILTYLPSFYLLSFAQTPLTCAIFALPIYIYRDTQIIMCIICTASKFERITNVNRMIVKFFRLMLGIDFDLKKSEVVLFLFDSLISLISGRTPLDKKWSQKKIFRRAMRAETFFTFLAKI